MKIFEFSVKMSLKSVAKGRINNIPALVEIMAWRHPGDKPLSEPMTVSLLTYICITRPQCVKVLNTWRVHLCDHDSTHLVHSRQLKVSWYWYAAFFYASRSQSRTLPRNRTDRSLPRPNPVNVRWFDDVRSPGDWWWRICRLCKFEGAVLYEPHVRGVDTAPS